MPPSFFREVITVELEDLKRRLANDFTQLSGENIPDDVTLGELLVEARQYLSRQILLDDFAENIFVPLYCSVKLLERRGYVDLAEKYWQRMRSDIAAWKKNMPDAQSTEAYSYSRPQVFSDDELAKW